MKKWKAILFGTMLTLSLCTFTACGTEVNNADETDNDGVMDNGGIIEDSGTDNNEMAGGNITVTPAGDGNNATAAPGTAGVNGTENGTENDGTVSGELGDSVKDLGDGVGNAVDDIGNAVGNAVEGR